MKQKKIIIFNPSLESGGVEKNLYLILNYLHKSILNLKIITCDEKKILEKGFNTNLVIGPKNFKYKSRIIKYFYCLYLLVKEIIENDKKIEVLSFQANLYAILVCKLFKVKIFVRSNSSSYGWANNFLKIYLFKKILKLATSVIVNSIELQKEFLKKFKIKTLVIYNPLNVNEIIKLSKNSKKNNFFKKKYINIIAIGRFTKQKNHLLILRAINILKNKINFKVLLIGQGEYLRLYKDFIKKNNIDKIVKIIKFQKNPFPFFRKSNLLVLTSLYEGFPNVLLEALTLNKFIISSDCPTGPKEILYKKKFGYLFKNNDLNDLIKKLTKYAINKNKIIVNQKEIKKDLSKFNYKKNMEKYRKLFF